MKERNRSIQLLPSGLQNQIAAGEVIERPASVLKELVENCLDAGATEISVVLENGGQTLISVRDNGWGIPKDEIPLALTSHATSKIISFEELTRVASYGFRGEALPSIASVGIVRIESYFRGSKDCAAADCAYFMETEYGTLKEEGPASLHEGTFISVRDLFSNVPARLKFLKTPATELRRSQEALTRLALVHPHCAFTLQAGGREVFHLPANMELKDRLARIWPPQIIEKMVDVSGSRHNIKVKGLISLPHGAQGRANRILIYINERPVNDRLIMAAIREAYKGRLTSREYPQAVLFINIDPREIDVNVHPAKNEVRFRDERSLFSAIINILRETIEKHSSFETFGQDEDKPVQSTELRNEARPLGFWGSLDRVGNLDRAKEKNSEDFYGDKSGNDKSGNDKSGTDRDRHNSESLSGSSGNRDFSIPINQNIRQIQESQGYYGSDNSHSQGNAFQGTLSQQGARFSDEDQNGLSAQGTSVYDSETSSGSVEHEWSGEERTAANRNYPSNFYSGYPVQVGNILCLGQIKLTYLILVQNDDLVLMDQHAAHEAVLLARIKKSNQKGQSQLLTLPEKLELHESEQERFEKQKKDLQKLGYELEFEKNILTVNGLPPLLSHRQALDILKDILADKMDDFEDIFHMMSCRSAIKAGQLLTADEAAGLLEQWQNSPNNMHCPHGRPIVIRLGNKELEKIFKRSIG